MEIKNLSKTNSLVNLANSILKYYGCDTYHESIKEIDEVLEKSNKQKICLVLLDAFGKAILEKHKKDAPFMYDHRFLVINSVFPTTTVAATTSITTGKYPIETGYIGWVQYFAKMNKCLETFSSRNRKDSSEIITPLVTDSLIKTKYITDDINEKFGFECAKLIMSFNYETDENYKKTNKKWFKAVDESISTNKFTYAYNTNPDHLMHTEGTTAKKVSKVIKNLNGFMKKITKKHQDTIFIVISDHGMIDVTPVDIREIPGFLDTLSKDLVVIESRFASFFVKDKEEFIKIYNNNEILKKNFILCSKDEILENNLFGYSKNKNKFALETLGDYFLIATNKYYLVDAYSGHNPFKAAHAGMNDDEIQVYLQVYNN